MPVKYRKSEIIEIAQNICDQLENGNEDKFFESLETVLVQKIPFGTLYPLAEVIGKRGLEKPELYFNILDKFFKKELDYGYKKGIINTSRMKMSEEEVQKSRVYGWRAGIVGTAFNEMSHKYYKEVVKRTRKYIIESAHWSSSDTFADKTFNKMFEERFEWILNILKCWAVDENKWLRNTAAFAIHAPTEKNILADDEFKKALEVLVLVIHDHDLNVKKKVAWTLKVTSKYRMEETFEFMKKWAKSDDKNAKWIIKKGMINLDLKKQDEILKLMDTSY
ncbi:MAG: DNA alkylation repair protein [Methanobacterium sp.]|uniref:DNA alkylation repair protein n=1 Tax=Methanobacterium sp. TaxID=2164 RepID=UPI003D650630|nr:DNA alkylation repair protein [Methanobacterium sp.]